MGRLRLLENELFRIEFNSRIIFTIIVIFMAVFGMNCKMDRFSYNGNLILDEYKWLSGKKIFIDPGHGGKGKSDLFRIGPGGITEEEINLRVSLILYDMLQRSGMDVRISRLKDMDIPLRERVDMVNEFEPDLLISVHHNGSPRRADEVNYPAVLIWGNRYNRPLSYDFAKLLLEEFQRIMDERGRVVSDFSVFPETGTMILRETRYTCPGVIGEAGFFSDEMHAKRLGDVQYNQLEAEAYFLAISEFFKRGSPGAKVYFSCSIDNEGILTNLITEGNPIIAIELDSGIKGLAVKKKSLRVTLDGLPLRYRFVNDSLSIINYGERLYPGGHSLRFSFRNAREQHSMIYRVGFTVNIKKGDYDRLVSDGLRLLKRRRSRREGLKMLLSALSMGLTDPDADRLLWNIAKGFYLMGDWKNSRYYYAKLYHFHPDSIYSRRIKRSIRSYRIPVEYHGKKLKINYDPSAKEYKNR